ncbi:hypothetical protein Tco_1158020, partial [Tanacetum coccineum]
LYDALEVSMDRENRKEFIEATLSLPLVKKSSGWKTSDTREAPSSSSKQKTAPQSEQPIDDVPIPDEVHISDSEDTGAAYLPKIKTIPKWVIPPNDLPETKNNWANALAKLYKDPKDHNDKERRNALSISKLKAAYYPDFRLEELVPSLWIVSKHDYDISAAYGISHWWFKLKEFYITRHSVPTDRKDYTIVHKPRSVIYKDRNNQKKMMRETKVHKFSDGTLTRILEKLDHMVKDFMLFKFNPHMEHRIWSEDDKKRSKQFIEVIERRLKIRRIFRNLESFVSGRVRDIDYRLIQRTE